MECFSDGDIRDVQMPYFFPGLLELVATGRFIDVKVCTAMSAARRNRVRGIDDGIGGDFRDIGADNL